MRRGVVRILGAALLFLGVALDSPAQNPEARELTALLPARVETMLYVRDAPAAMARFRAASVGGGVAFEDLIAAFEGSGAGTPGWLEGLFGASGRIERHLTGGFVLARIGGSQNREPATLVAFEHGSDPAAILADLMPPRGPRRRVDRRAASWGGIDYWKIESVRETTAGRGGALPTSLSRRAGARSQQVDRYDLYVGDSLVILAGGQGEGLRDALNRLNPRARRLPSFNDSMRRRGALEPYESPPDVELYADLYLLTGAGDRVIDESLLGAGVDLDRLGIGEIQSISSGITFEADGVRVEAHLYAPQPRRGLGRLMFLGRPLAERGARPAPAFESAGYWTMGIDIPAFWSELRATLREGAPGLDGLIDLFLEPQGPGSGAGFESGVMANLGTRWGSFWPAAGGRSGPIHAVEVRDAARLRRGVRQWLGGLGEMLGYPFHESTADGVTWFQLEGATAGGGSLIDISPLAHLALTEEWLLLGSDLGALRRAVLELQTDPEIVAARARPEDPARAAIFARMPADRFFEAWLDLSALDAFLGSGPVTLLDEVSTAGRLAAFDLDRFRREPEARARIRGASVWMNTDEHCVNAALTLHYRDPIR